MLLTRTACMAHDAADPLAALRARFRLPAGRIYLDGNSLGALPLGAAAAVHDVVDRQWGDDLITSWNAHGWIDLPFTLGARIAPLLGAEPGSVIVCDSTSVNLFKAAAAALALRAPRRVIVTEAGNFPTDVYMLEGLARLTGATLRSVPAEQLVAALNDDTALLMLTHTHYRTGAVHDMAALSAAAHAAGALTLWDLSHSAGALALDLAGDGADFAVGCGYKFLNGGPGAPAYLYVAAAHQAKAQQPLSGWMGHAEPFAFEPGYRPAAGMARWLTGTPSVVAMAALAAGLDTFEGADPAALEAKSRALGDVLLALVAALCPALEPACPTGSARRGAQVSFAHPDAYAITQALIADGVIGDFRAPNVLRFGLPALYTRFVDVWDAAERLAAIMVDGRWRDRAFSVPQKVT